MSKKGVLTVISGFSGAGKGTIMKQLIEKYPYFSLYRLRHVSQEREK